MGRPLSPTRKLVKYGKGRPLLPTFKIKLSRGVAIKAPARIDYEGELPSRPSQDSIMKGSCHRGPHKNTYDEGRPLFLTCTNI